MSKLSDNIPASNVPFKSAQTVADLMATDRTDWEYVSIPDENPLGHKHASIGLNKLVFEPGETYQLPHAIAMHVKERLKVYARSCIRLINSKADFAAQRSVPFGNAPGEIIDATQINTVD